MPLHDWKDERGWDGVHLLWLAQLLDWIQPRLPPGFRAYVGSVPALTLEASNGKPDVTVRGWQSPPSDAAPQSSAALVPDRETVATFTLDPQRAIHVDWHGQLGQKGVSYRRNSVGIKSHIALNESACALMLPDGPPDPTCRTGRGPFTSPCASLIPSAVSSP
jgi:hypothetical protein